MTIVGLPDAAVQESRERVQSAIKNAGLIFPRKRVIVNLAPASVRKEGPYYDLPIALGVLVMTGMVPAEAVESSMVVGELSLDGSVRHAKGVLPMAAAARQNGFTRIIVPETDRSSFDSRPGRDSGHLAEGLIPAPDRGYAHPATSAG
jgi:magnesium chelatase family protein